MTGPRSTAPAAPTVWGHVRHAGRVIALTAYGLLTALGALTAPAPSLGIGVLLGALGGAVVAGLHRVPGLPPLPHPAVAITRLVCLPAAIAGTAVLGASAGVVVGLGLAAATAFAAHWSALPPAGSPPRGPGVGAETVEDEETLRELLRHLPIDALLDEWRDTQTPSDASSGRTSHGVRLRELLIDEMQRRNPTGTTRWLVDGFDEPPDGYVGGRTG